LDEVFLWNQLTQVAQVHVPVSKQSNGPVQHLHRVNSQTYRRFSERLVIRLVIAIATSGHRPIQGEVLEKESVKVLVVEDELFCRIHAVNLVEEAGYEAIEATNADDAIRILEARKDIRIVFTDINMPGSMDGLKLSHAIRTRWPPIELILTSGYFAVNDADLPERSRFFAKPYADEQLIGTLRHFAGN
jgi:CheY-like chemotaxis protein